MRITSSEMTNCSDFFTGLSSFSVLTLPRARAINESNAAGQAFLV